MICLGDSKLCEYVEKDSNQRATSEWILLAHFYHQINLLFSVSVLRYVERGSAIEERHHCSETSVVLRPEYASLVVRVEFVDEINQEVCHVSGTIDIGQVC